MPHVKILYQSESLHLIEILVKVDQELHIQLQYKDKSSCYPTNVTIKKSLEPDIALEEEEAIQHQFKHKHLKQVLVDIVNNNNPSV